MGRNILLEDARTSKGLSIEEAARAIGVHRNTLSGWERGAHQPHVTYIKDLCQLYDATPRQLGLEQALHVGRRGQHQEDQEEEAPAPTLPVKNVILGTEELEVRLMALLLRWDHRKTCYDELRFKVIQQIEGETSMTQHNGVPDPQRRKALRFLATLPISVYGLTFVSSERLAPAEEMLPQLASGLTACWPLTKTSELEFVQAVALSYLPTLAMLAKQPSRHQHEAMRLTAEAHMLSGLMGMHLRGLSVAKQHFSQAVSYSERTTDDNLKAQTLRMLSSTYAYEKHFQDALDICKKATIYEKTVSPLIRSDIYAGLARFQAQCDYEQDALRSLGKAHEAFAQQSGTDPDYIRTLHDQFGLTLQDGQTHLYLGQYKQAQDSFEQVSIVLPDGVIVDPIPNERIRLEFLNNQAQAELLRPDRDMQRSLTCWRVAMKGAIDLGSEQRYNEAYNIRDQMNIAWANESRVKELDKAIKQWTQEKKEREMQA